MKKVLLFIVFLLVLATSFAPKIQAQQCISVPFIGVGSRPCNGAYPTRCGVEARCCQTADDCKTPSPTGTAGTIDNQTTSICEFAADKDKTPCQKCFGEGNSWTALGCIQTASGKFITQILDFGVGIAGGIAFLLILFGGLQIVTSAGNPEQLNAGRELVGSAIAGLLLIIFSVFLLRLIGVDILGIPGFT